MPQSTQADASVLAVDGGFGAVDGEDVGEAVGEEVGAQVDVISSQLPVM